MVCVPSCARNSGMIFHFGSWESMMSLVQEGRDTYTVIVSYMKIKNKPLCA